MNDTCGHADGTNLLHPESNDGTDASPRPNPTGLAALIELETVDRHRSFLCEEYDRCLDEALRNDWPSWSCERCPIFARGVASQAMRFGHEALAV
jgi:hypothetical protein